MIRHMLFVFTDCIVGREDEYNLWYDEVHVPRMLSVAGYAAIERFFVSPFQLSEEPPPGRFLAIIELAGETPEMALEARRQLRGVVPLSPALLKTDAWVYSSLASPKPGTPLDPIAFSDEPIKHRLLIFSNCAAGTDHDFNSWYDQEHFPLMLSIPGYRRGQRFCFSDHQLSKTRPPGSYLAAIDLDGGTPEAALKARRLFQKPVKLNPLMQEAHAWVFSALGPRRSGT